MQVVKYVVLALAVAATSAHALTQREQQEAAQRAYQESSKSYEEAAKGFQGFKDAAEQVRDGAREALRFLR